MELKLNNYYVTDTGKIVKILCVEPTIQSKAAFASIYCDFILPFDERNNPTNWCFCFISDGSGSTSVGKIVEPFFKEKQKWRDIETNDIFELSIDNSYPNAWQGYYCDNDGFRCAKNSFSKLSEEFLFARCKRFEPKKVKFHSCLTFKEQEIEAGQVWEAIKTSSDIKTRMVLLANYEDGTFATQFDCFSPKYIRENYTLYRHANGTLADKCSN